MWGDCEIHISAEDAGGGELLQSAVRRATGIDCPLVTHEDWSHRCLIAPPAGPRSRAGTPPSGETRESYTLSVEESSIALTGADSDGLFWGIQTLTQLLEDSPTLLCLEIHDAPALAVRGVHLDLKGGTPTIEYLHSVVDRLSSLKINTVMVEYEDKLRYDRHPAIASQSAFSKDEIRNFVEHARELHVEVMPLLQCLGHVEYILKRPEYAAYRESADHVQQWCPENPATFELFTGLADELLELHPHSLYFHIGGDEARQIGECPECAARVAKVGRHRFYLEWVKRICEYVISRGKIPVLWDDMLARHEPELIDELPAEAILMYWNYSITSEARSFLSTQGGWVYSREWTKKQYDGANGLPVTGKGKKRFIIEELPQEAQRLYRRHSQTTDFPRLINTTLFMEVIGERDRRMIGAPGAQPGGHKILSNPEGSYPNIRLFARAALANGAEGIVATGWTRNGSLREPNGIIPGMWPGFFATAEHGWSGGDVSDRELDRKLNKRLFGIDGFNATDAIWLIRHLSHVPSGEDLHDWLIALAGRASRNEQLLRYYAVMADLFSAENELATFTDKTERYYYAAKHGTLTERERNHYLRETRAVRETLDRAEAEMREAYSTFLQPAEVEDCVDSFVDFRRKLLSFHESMVG